MATVTTTKSISSTYSLIVASSVTAFKIQNIDQKTQVEIVWADSLPADTVKGFVLNYLDGVDETWETNNIYAKVINDRSGSVLVNA